MPHSSGGHLKNHLEKLIVLEALGQHGSMTKAGKHLSLSQSAVSHAIKTLEKALDLRLITQSPSGFSFTEAGTKLFEFSQKLFSDVNDLEKILYKETDEKSGTVLVGTHETLAIHVWPKLLTRFAKRHPRIKVSVMSGRIEELVKGLVNRHFHLIFSVKPTERPELAITPIYRGVMGLYVGKNPEFKRCETLDQEVISLNEANKLPILTDVHAHVSEGLPIPTFLKNSGLTLEHLHAFNSFEAAIKNASLGLGIAVIPDRNAAEAVQAGLIRPIKIAEIDPTTFGAYQICATVLKGEVEFRLRDALLDELIRP